MFYNRIMDSWDRLRLLSSDMEWETAEELPNSPPCFNPQKQNHIIIFEAKTPAGQPMRMLKTLLSSVCERDCYYCPFRAGRDFRRASFKAEEFARLFINLYRAGIAQGIFLSSGIAGGGIRTQDKLIDTAEILRTKLGFKGYLHLKIMPGAEKDQVLRAMQVADRLSINLEAPNPERLERLAPHKNFFDEILKPLQWVEEMRQTLPSSNNWKGRWPSSTTQFVLGGAGESDLELLSATEWLNRNVGLTRAYYSPFRPVPDTPLENQPPADLLRQRRLYQASFLLRDYGFSVGDFDLQPDGNLPLEIDPKLAWARRFLLHSPLEVNTAEPEQLLRVPGIGPKAVRRIIQIRRQQKLQDSSTLQKLGVQIERAAPYLLLDGKNTPVQLSLFR